MQTFSSPTRPPYRFLLLAWIGQLLYSLWVGRGIALDVSEQSGLLAWAYVVWAVLAWHITFTLLPLVLLFPALRWISWCQGPKARSLCAALLWLPWCLFSYADAVVYQLYGYHVDGMVLNVLLNPASSDSVEVGVGTLTALYLGFAGSAFACCCITGIASWLDLRSAPVRPLRRTSLLLATLGLGAFLLGEKLVYAVAIQTGATTLTQVRPLLGPLYFPFTARSFMKDVFGLEVAQGPRVISGNLHYPAPGLSWKEPAPAPDIVLVIIESAHAGGMEQQVMPNLHAFAQANLSSAKHYANANATRYGIFSIMYGILPTYWPAAEATQHEALLMQRVRDLDYDLCIVSSTNLHFPEFRETVFSHTDPTRIHDTWPEGSKAVERDARAITALSEHLRSAGDKPVFGWLFLDGPHYPYNSDPASAPFQPAAAVDDLNLLTMHESVDAALRQALRNRSLNALHTVDARLATLLAAIAQREQDSGRPMAVVIVGDHGEGFGEFGGRGHFVHNGAFSVAQTTTVFAAKIPGLAPQVLPGPTSHLDIATTLLHLLGAQGERDTYAQGRIWGVESPAEWVLCANWNEAAVMFGPHTLRFGIGAHNMGVSELRDEHYRLITANSEVEATWRRVVQQAALERGRFLRRH